MQSCIIIGGDARRAKLTQLPWRRNPYAEMPDTWRGGNYILVSRSY